MLSKLYIITDDHAPSSHAQQLEAASMGGCQLVQFRMKSGSESEIETQLSECVEVANKFNTTLIVND